MTFARWAMIAGFGIAFIGIFLTLLTGDRSLGFGVFMVGFFLAGGGIVANTFSIPYVSDTKPILFGLRISAVGFGAILIGSFISLVFNQHSLSTILFYGGSITFIIGILLGINSVAKSNG